MQEGGGGVLKPLFAQSLPLISKDNASNDLFFDTLYYQNVDDIQIKRV